MSRERVLTRCLDELGRAICYLRALRGIDRAETYHAVDFIRLSSWALRDQMFAHVIKVLGKKEEAGFWSLHDSDPDFFADQCIEQQVSLNDIRAVMPKLNKIRNKTLFHLDRAGVLDPTKVWSDADMTYGQFEVALNTSFGLLNALHDRLHGSPYPMPDYDGTDATRLAQMAEADRAANRKTGADAFNSVE